jgi:hypothetical protein
MSIAWGSSDAASAALLLYLAVAYIAYIASGALPSDQAPARRPPRRVLADRAAFALFFAALPLAAFRILGWKLPGLEVLSWGAAGRGVAPTIILGAVSWAVGRYSKKGPGERANYPQYLPARWGPAELALEVGSWAGYLFAYEFAFRGMVLYALLPLGTMSAVAAETALYSFAHLPKSSKEAAGSVLFGVAVSCLTLAYGTILPAFVLHLAMALGNDRGCWAATRRAPP